MSLIRQCGWHLQIYIKRRAVSHLLTTRIQTKKLDYATIRLYSIKTNLQELNISKNHLEEEQKPLLQKLEKTVLSICLDAKKKRIVYEELLYIVENYSSCLNQLDEQAGLIFLQCCGEMLPDTQPKIRHKLMERVWDLVVTKTEKLTVEHYNTLLNTLIQNGQCVDLHDFLKNMTVKANAETYHYLLRMFANKGNSGTLDEIIKIMQDANIETISNPVYEALIHCQFMNNHLNNALVYLEVMESYNLKPDRETMKIFTCGYTRLGKLESLSKLMKASIYTDKDIMEIVKCLSKTGHGEHIPTVLKFLPESIDNKNPEISNTVVELVNSNRVQDAVKILLELSSDNTYDLIKEMFKVGTKDDVIIKIVTELSKINGISALHAAQFALAVANESLVFLLFQIMKNNKIDIKPHFYWPLLVKCSAVEGEKKIFSILDHMAMMNVKADQETLRDYVIPYINTTEPSIAFKKCEKYAESKSAVLTAFLTFYLSNGKFQPSFLILKSFNGKPQQDEILKSLLQAYSFNKNVENYAIVLKMLDDANKLPSQFLNQFVKENIKTIEKLDDETKIGEFFKFIKKVKFLIRAYRKHNLKVSVFTADQVVENLYSKVDDQNGKQKLRVLFEGILESTNKSLYSYTDDVLIQQCEQELQNSTDTDNRIVLKKLLLLHCRENNLRKAEEIKEKLDDLRIEWSPVMHASMLLLYSLHGMALEALLQFRTLQKDHSYFRIDEPIILQYATALAERNRIDDVIEVLTNNGVCSPSVRNVHNCRNLLNAIAHSSPNRTEEVFEILISKDYCKIQNFILEPIVQSYIIQNDISGAIKTFKNFAENYQLTPSTTELMTSLCKKCIPSPKLSRNIIEIYKIVKSIHGDQEANVSLIIASARAKNSNYLLAALKMVADSGGLWPNLMTDLRKSFNYLPLEEKSETVNMILDTCLEKTDLDIVPLCNVVLSVYNELGDYESAVRLWQKMLSNEIMITNKFRNAFISLLNVHKIPIPDGFGLSYPRKRIK